MKSFGLKSLLSAGLLALIVMTVPVAGFAKDKDRDHEREDNRDRGCFRAFGHLVAPGWIKHNGEIEWSVECNLPFGIGKKFRGNNATTTSDITAPIISEVNAKPAKKQVEISWKTDEKSDSTVFWSTTTPVSTSGVGAINRFDFTRNHEVVLKKLTASTTYYAIVRSRDANGNTAYSSTFSFTTKPQAVDSEVPVISNVVTAAGTSTIQVGWKTQELTTGRIYYSTLLPVLTNASTTVIVPDATSTKNHIVTLSGLTPNTRYYMIVEATDAAGNVTTSGTFAATTGVVVVPPTDTTAPVISDTNIKIGSGNATISWNTDEFATSKIYYATSSPVDVSATSTLSISDSTLVKQHLMSLSGLATSTTYYFVIESKDASGNTARSSVLSFIQFMSF